MRKEGAAVGVLGDWPAMRAASQFIAGVAPMTATAAWLASGMGWALDDVAAGAPVRAQRFAEVEGVGDMTHPARLA